MKRADESRGAGVSRSTRLRNRKEKKNGGKKRGGLRRLLSEAGKICRMDAIDVEVRMRVEWGGMRKEGR